MKQILTKKQNFNLLGKENSYLTLHAAELRVQWLESIIEGLLFCKEGSSLYEAAKDAYLNDYVESE